MRATVEGRRARAMLAPVLLALTGCSSSSGAGPDAGIDAPAGSGGAVVGSGGAATGSGGQAGAGGAASGSGGQAGAGGAASGSGGKVGAGGSSGSGGQTGGGGAPGSGGKAGAGGANGSGGVGGAACIGSALLTSLGSTTILVGGSMADATAGQAPFDGRYLYLSGGLFDGQAPCTSCSSGCTVGGSSCANANPNGCGWWGCWQWDQDPPGQYVVSFTSKCQQATWQGAGRAQRPMLTYYEELHASGLNEGTAQVAALNDAAFLTRYLADWRFVLQKIGNQTALLHIEPDFWGYVQHLNADPHAVAAKVTTANPTDCAGYENSAAGVARCMIHMVRLYAPNARVGLHASAWATKTDVLGNSSASLDVPAEAQKLATFLIALGARDGDFIVADFSDRDAGYYQSIGRSTWWDATNATLPSFRQAFTWVKSLTEALNLPAIVWQIPVGNTGLADTTDRWRDNRLDYLFGHMNEVAAAHIVALFFGAGATGMTTPETDGGNFIARMTAYRSTGGTPLCP